jgi:hypothetical protein
LFAVQLAVVCGACGDFGCLSAHFVSEFVVNVCLDCHVVGCPLITIGHVRLDFDKVKSFVFGYLVKFDPYVAIGTLAVAPGFAADAVEHVRSIDVDRVRDVVFHQQY